MASKAQMEQLRALRDASKALIRNDIALLKGERGAPTPGSRLKQSAGKKAGEAADTAAALTKNNSLTLGALLALLLGAIVAWLFRDKIFEALDALFDGLSDEVQDEETHHSEKRS